MPGRPENDHDQRQDSGRLTDYRRAAEQGSSGAESDPPESSAPGPQAAGSKTDDDALDRQPEQAPSENGAEQATPRPSDSVDPQASEDGAGQASLRPSERAVDPQLRASEKDRSEDDEAHDPGRLALDRRDSGEADLAGSDPVTDLQTRAREAGVDDLFPFGRPGRPLTRNHPFVFGFFGALGVLAAYILVQAATDAREVIILIVVALFLAVGLNPAVEAIERVGLKRQWAVLLVFLGLVGCFVGFGFAIVPPLSEQVSAFIHNLTSGNGYIEQLQNNPRLQDWDHRYHLLEKAKKALQSRDLGTQAANGVLGVGQVVISGVFSTLTVLILTLYFLSSLPNITGFMYRLAPRSRRARVALLGDEILTRIGGYVAGNLLISLIAGVSSYIVLLIANVPYALALALVVAIMDLIPLVGATIGAILVTAVAFFSGLWTGVAVAIFFAVYQQVENYIIQPRVMKRSVDVQPAVTIIAALIGGTLLGMIGALLAIPAAAAFALILREVVVPRQDQL